MLTKTNWKIGDKVFFVATPSIWNQLST